MQRGGFFSRGRSVGPPGSYRAPSVGRKRRQKKACALSSDKNLREIERENLFLRPLPPPTNCPLLPNIQMRSLPARTPLLTLFSSWISPAVSSWPPQPGAVPPARTHVMLLFRRCCRGASRCDIRIGGGRGSWKRRRSKGGCVNFMV